MKKELFTFTGTAGNSLPAVIWLPEKTPKLLFQITHGMTEHSLPNRGLLPRDLICRDMDETRDARTVHLLVK